ncbi:DUF3656 domain-containing protein [Paraclostridium bifermentans]|uniref:DUF3656 domain-containing protein n=1 Tax=Paraclostridium bifermentans TaxID=1490 RepID=A0ABY8R376_PARBF|nr:DUF3656 domain-containing protein [Paraclostridium bifermentans]
MLNTIKKSFEEDVENIKIRIDATIELKLGQPPKLRLKDGYENDITVTNEKIVEKAMKVALGEEKIVSQIKKLGNTAYVLRNIDVDIDEDISLPISVLNQLRRDAIDKLSNERVIIKNRNFKDSFIKYSPKVIKEEKI